MQGSNFYNDCDRTAAAWLRELAHCGHIPPGVIDAKDIREINPHDLNGFTQVHLFAGIGGWSRALRLAGWPECRPVWTGSPPCQPFSTAGKRRGELDVRHLWPEMRRLVAECRPPTVFGEQVASRDGREWLARVRVDLEALGYVVGAADLCAAGVASPHIRQRLYWVAHARRGESERRGNSGSVRAQTRGLESETRERERGGDAARGGGSTGRMVYAAQSGRERQPGPGEGAGQRISRPSSSAGGVGDDPGSGRGARGGDEVSGHGSGAGFWDAFDVIVCRDDKARRVEPGTFPLAHGVPGRVGLLRGYGNGIVPPLAAAFIVASLQAIDDTEAEEAEGR